METGSTQDAAFEEAKRAIYFIYEQKTYTQLYKNCLDAQAAYENMKPKMNAQYQKTSGKNIINKNLRTLVNTLCVLN